MQQPGANTDHTEVQYFVPMLCVIVIANPWLECRDRDVSQLPTRLAQHTLKHTSLCPSRRP